MKKLSIFAVVSGLALIGCSQPNQRYALKEDVVLRLQADDDCGYCRSVRYSTDGRGSTRIKVGSMVARHGDILYLEREGNDPVAIRFKYSPSAADRIRRITTDHVGAGMVMMIGEEAVNLSRISEPLSTESVISGMTEIEADYLIAHVASGPYVADH